VESGMSLGGKVLEALGSRRAAAGSAQILSRFRKLAKWGGWLTFGLSKLALPQLRLPHLLRFFERCAFVGRWLGRCASFSLSVYQHQPRSSGKLEVFHSPLVTSDLAPKIKLRNHDRGRNGRVSPNRHAPKLLVLKNLVSKFFDIRVLRRNSR
jgi:hypothetical protein